MNAWRSRQTGFVVWMLLLMLSSTLLVALSGILPTRNPQQQARLQTLAVLARAEQALLAYAMQPLGTTQCASNCSRPGDLPCPDLNNDGVAESSWSGAGTHLGRLPWKTLGLGDVRDASGERLWYAVSDNYKNNPRLRPLNAETAGTWSVLEFEDASLDATLGRGAVAVLIAPMQPLTRTDGWVQQRSQQNSESAKDYLDLAAALDNAGAIENSVSGFIQVQPSANFNDMVWPVTATRIHRIMQQQVLFELKRVLTCTAATCAALPAAAEISDTSCLRPLSLTAGSCVSVAASSLGRLPLDSQAHWPLAANHMLDGDSSHHWFQQNGWREQVFYRPQSGSTLLLVAGESAPGQSRQTESEKSVLANYLEAHTLQALALGTVAVPIVEPNDVMDSIITP